MATRKVQKYLISEMFYGRQEVHKYLSNPEIFLYFLLILMVVSRIIYIIPRLFHVMCHYYIKKIRTD